MKSLLFLAVLCLQLWSCQSKTNSQSQVAPQSMGANADAAEGAKQEPGLITLDKAEENAAHVVVENIQPKNVAQSVTAPGKLAVNEDRTWRVGAIAPGRIDDLFVKVGDSVRAGQVLARIHSDDVHQARAIYREASAELDRARSAAAYAKQRRDRAKRLFELKAGSRQDVELADSELANTEAQISKAQAEIQKERAHLMDILHVPVGDNSQRGNSESASTAHEDAQDDIPVLAPASGLVFERRVTVGSVVAAGEVLFSLTDTNSLWMIAAANESDLSMLHSGQTVQVRVRAYPEEAFRGQILRLGEKLDPTTRTLEVRIQVPNSRGLLKPEMYASATIEQPGRRPSLYLSDTAIQNINGEAAVFLRRADKRFEARTIKIGQHVNGETEVLEGLHAGDAVVVRGAFMLKSQLLKSTIRED